MKLLLIREFMLFQSVLPALRLLLSKTDQHATHFFNACVSPSSCDTWYSDQPLQKQSCRGFMRDICKSAECQITYTPHCLRATAISSMNDAGFQDRHIMFTRTNDNTVFRFSFFLVFRITLYWQNIWKANISNDFIVTFLIITIYENYECPFFGNWKFHRKNQFFLVL